MWGGGGCGRSMSFGGEGEGSRVVLEVGQDRTQDMTGAYSVLPTPITYA